MRSSWQERQARTREWLAREGPAEQMLLFYLELLELQEAIYRRSSTASWDERMFHRFLRDLDLPTEVLAATARCLEDAGPAAREELLAAYLRREPFDDMASALGCGPIPLEFFPRAFLQPVFEALQEKRPVEEGDVESQGRCPVCGWPPQVGVLRDEADIRGRRLLVCSLCSSWWRFRRSCCSQCGETDPEKLEYHVNDATPHLRIDACRSCGEYLKTVDLRKDGRAVPVVEDLASVELDLWCGEQELRKIQLNLLGY